MRTPWLWLLALLLAVLSCTPAAWQAQAQAASAVQQAADLVALPALETAYREGGMEAIGEAASRAEVESALNAHRARWRPVWDCWDAFQAAHSAWLTAIEQQTDPLPTALAARTAFCKLRVAAVGLGVRLPDFPAARCS